ncbi:MAG TPA: DNA phosphorothioation-associated protein 4 [Cyanobacteria bacterium UBA11149]|nr:DNA phosphorothioation-associated protein 4 [Cyanobacteria bacterium UBA11367]HBE58523.1 DNA phosphorothioation-associated protein 4 [Cyanobacteria bacterium UBA11366]HBK65329.1 DNA phosphorothioation-associated protein 4 [Cyanobacteria bacterium UBA11166]HBR72438.1 DNA phosphorothioation-associated protein 4 [Cyanobacteria bacterium UBA11159]HBS69728.1 DNA phosphorothioation-associated protein 4 [Cyanobacteria bacterium UBA11153]HBW90381.1 DNA phosphorothioation-associated protein 4 [Cyano
MSGNRIRVAKDKADLVKALVASAETTGPFQTYADAIAFAAAMGAKKKKRSPLGIVAKREPGPIALEIFVSRGYDVIMKLLAIAQKKEAKILSAFDARAEEERIHIFEEYANGGLEILRDEFVGAVDYTERLLLILSNQRLNEEVSEGDFDLSRFL